MAIRGRFRRGRHLVTDDWTGRVHYDDEMVKNWDGAIVHRRNYETRQPQEFVEAKDDPQPADPQRQDQFTASVSNLAPTVVGATNVPAPRGPAYHLYLGIGNMTIGTDFIVS